MAYLDRVLQEPGYGWSDAEGNLVVPTFKQLLKEAGRRVNIFSSRKNWISMISWLMILCLVPFFVLFITQYFSIPYLILFILYATVIMGTHGTIWYHRYGTHRSYTFSNPVWRFITQNLVLKTFPEEIYIISHHVHHAKSDKPGDPYNARGGFWYCMFSDVNHQSIAKNLSLEDYNRTASFMKHTGVRLNNYDQYLKWGSVASPFYTLTLWLANWTFWYAALYLIGGHGLACTIFGATMVWFIFIRAFNYTGHGKGEEKHIDGMDFDRSNLSVNQMRPGLLTGEWHNNHHLYPASARSGFLPYQLDLAWIYIFSLYKLGGVSTYRDNKKEFLRKYKAIMETTGQQYN